MKILFPIILIFSLIVPFSVDAQINVVDGDLIKTSISNDVYIVKGEYKRLILNPEIFNQYGHLKWSNIKTVSQAELDEYTTSDLVRAQGDEKVYKLYPQHQNIGVGVYPSGDIGEKRWIKTAEDFNGFGYKINSIYEINSFERDFYVEGAFLTFQASPTPPTPPTSRTISTTLRVPAEYPTIQSAINASINGDTISISFGTYNENITIDKSIKLISNYASGVVINGGGIDDAITIKGDQISIQRFTIKSKDKYGIYCESGSVTIKNSTINDSGWGIVAENNCQITVLNNIIYNNKKSDNKDGVGILIKNNFTYNIISEIRNNVITDNYHGIWSENSNTKVLNNIITKNVGGVGSAESTGIYHFGTGTSDNSYNNVWSNGWNYRGDASAGNGGIDLNPKFINEAQRDYRLQMGTTDYSPCINTGNSDFIYNDGILITDGNHRNDMGAYGGPDNISWTP